MPTEILAERDRLPEGMLEEILEARAYERAYAVYQQDPRHATGEFVDMVKLLDFERAQEELHGG